MYSYVIRRNLLDIITHLLIAAISSVIIYWIYAKPLYILIFIAGAMLIDLDHLIDYILFFKNNFSLREFFACMQVRSGKAYLFLHSWEIVFCFALLGWATRSTGVLVFSLSLGIHLMVDNIQRENLLAYLLIYRIIKKFNIRVIFPESRIYFGE